MKYNFLNVKRITDLILCCIFIGVLLIPFVLICSLVKLTSSGPIFYWSERVGINNHLFKMPKFRSMKIDAPEIASHLMTDPDLYLTPIGSFLRTTSLDEMPQLWSILVGDMSFVGPRPALFNQDDLIALRKECKVDSLIPGLTGWAQINGRDNLPLSEKVKLDFEYLNRKSLWFDLKILWLTALRVIDRDNISH
jgi:O-antigen biosynthesis protein WbqP